MSATPPSGDVVCSLVSGVWCANQVLCRVCSTTLNPKRPRKGLSSDRQGFFPFPEIFYGYYYSILLFLFLLLTKFSLVKQQRFHHIMGLGKKRKRVFSISFFIIIINNLSSSFPRFKSTETPSELRYNFFFFFLPILVAIVFEIPFF